MSSYQSQDDKAEQERLEQIWRQEEIERLRRQQEEIQRRIDESIREDVTSREPKQDPLPRPDDD